jgi:hypothetical protein
MIKLYNIILEALSDNAKKKAKEKFKKDNPELTDSVIDYYLNKFSDKQQSPVITNKDIMQYKFEDLEKLIDKNFPKTSDSSGDDEVDFKGSEDVVLNENGLLVLIGDLKEKCIRYGRGYSWCISRKDQSNMFFSYRMRLNEPVFYFIFDEDKPKDDKFHAMVIYINAEGEYYVANASNEGDKKMSWDKIEELQPKLKGHKELFKHIPLSSGEREDYNKFKDPNKSYDWYKDLSYEEKEKYIGFGHDLTEDQILDTPKPLISKYVTTTVGANIPRDVEESLSTSDRNLLRKNRVQLYGEVNTQLLFDFRGKREVEIKGNLDLQGGSLPKNFQLPPKLTVKGDLVINNVTNLVLPKILLAEGNLEIMNTTLHFGGDNKKSISVTKRFTVTDCVFKYGTLPDSLKVGTNFNLTSTAVESLPQNMSVGTNFLIKSCTNLKELPSNLNVGGNLDLLGSQVQDIPKDVKVGGEIFLSPELRKKYKTYNITTADLKESSEDTYSKALNEYLKQ